MDLSILWLVLAFYTREHSASSFARVLRVSTEEYANNILTTYDNKTNYVDCAKVCKTDCVSFTFDPQTKECKTFAKMFCQNDTASKSTKAMMFAKMDRELHSNPADCSEVNPAVYCSGIYRVTPTPGVSFDVYCEMDTANGPWTVIQNRRDGEEEFYRPWADYKQGFGDLRGNFWLGNDAIHHLTSTESILRIELVTWLGDAAYAQYSTFRVENETESYRLIISGFSGNVTQDNMAIHNGMSFSTFDRDNDRYSQSCAMGSKGGWWYNSCYDANLNGAEYMSGDGNVKSLVWDNFYPDIAYPHMMTTRMLLKYL
ncbi:angiopoietin-related protein 7-like [Mizuhopecten yessoensis]|uniref:angiopoietin-related protein 7-like n=1 Tax=Mizuhopecten yessoensis TaxID=6573 RepID=UPI000B45A4AB|nr:angiopoietin-related protein 7-like [Mizuhopecten yessoensis]